MSKKVLTEKEERELLDGLDKIIGDKETDIKDGENSEEEYMTEEEEDDLLNTLKEYSTDVLDNIENYQIFGTIGEQGVVIPVEDFDKILAVLKAVELA